MDSHFQGICPAQVGAGSWGGSRLTRECRECVGSLPTAVSAGSTSSPCPQGVVGPMHQLLSAEWWWWGGVCEPAVLSLREPCRELWRRGNITQRKAGSGPSATGRGCPGLGMSCPTGVPRPLLAWELSPPDSNVTGALGQVVSVLPPRGLTPEVSHVGRTRDRPLVTTLDARPT